MGLLDSVTSMLGSSGAGKEGGGTQTSVLAAALEYVNEQPGGISGLIQQFQQHGLGGVISSWVGTGANQPISPDQVQSALGDGAMGSIAQKAGVSPDQISTVLSQVLPHLVDKATPNGEVPQDGTLNAGSIMGALGGLFGPRT
ncbi:hypothetical protein LMG28138_04469 [Pararobbsia alpina]|uniref:DUF937 domain-containing protein n=2 Tax=Pararobbsia alpina TaxID=621374 RepID=A0A6S7C0J2_9BURK|nr:hypothetical protein LMG28138_04469 [Pararobbsia alpina]